jgi:nitroreductase
LDLFEAITNGQSIRNFKKQALPEGTVEKLTESARIAPSAGNVQPWLLLCKEIKKQRSALAKAVYGQKYIEDAPVVIVVCADEAGAQNR